MENIGRTVVLDTSGHTGVITKVRFVKTMINGVMRSVKLFEVEETAQPCPEPVFSEIFAHNTYASGLGSFSSAFSKGFTS